jgi:hypothetical protein
MTMRSWATGLVGCPGEHGVRWSWGSGGAERWLTHTFGGSRSAKRVEALRRLGRRDGERIIDALRARDVKIVISPRTLGTEARSLAAHPL